MVPTSTTGGGASVPVGDGVANGVVAPDPTLEQTKAQMLWNNHMKNPQRQTQPYNDTAVLLLSWKNGDLNTGPEARVLSLSLLY
jgi:hypothetical protein